MPWNAVWPDGTNSVKGNKPAGVQNTTYIKTTMGGDVIGTNAASTEDHFWDVDADLNGHHRFMKTPAFTVGSLPADPVFGVGIDAVWYSKLKSVAESVAQQDVNPFFKNVGAILQVLGIRAMAVFAYNSGAGTTTTVYSHNMAGVTRTDTGLYTATFNSALPSNAYLVLGGAIRDGSSTDELGFFMQGSHTIDGVKSTARAKIQFQSVGGTFRDPLQGWVVMFGG